MMIFFPRHKQKRLGGKVIMLPVQRKAYLSTEEVAQLLGFSVRTVTLWFNKWHETGGLEGIPGFKVGKSWRAERKEIEAWIETQKVRPIQAATIPLRQAR
jgi:excisionase family DNA binding protein